MFTERVPWDFRRRFTPTAAVVMAWEAWRTNLAQAVLAKFYRVHQSAISRTVRLVSAGLACELARLDPPIVDVPDTALIIDGTLIPTGTGAMSPAPAQGTAVDTA